MPRRRTNGAVAAWAEAQRRQQRQFEAQLRAQRSAQLAGERAVRAAVRVQARGQRERWQAYQAGREADATARTAQIDRQVSELGSLLKGVLAAPPFTPELLIQPMVIPPFNPGPLAIGVPLPDVRRYQVPQPTGLRSLSGAGRGDYQRAVEQARQQFDYDTQVAVKADERRRAQLDAYYGEYRAWAEQERRRIAEHNASVDDLVRCLAAGEPAAFPDYFSAAVYLAGGWPPELPRQVQVAWDGATSQLVIDWELPGYEAVPAITRYRYIKSDDRETQIARPAGERKALYRQLLAQITLAVLAISFRADRAHQISSITLNGYIRCPDPATGRQTAAYLLTSTASWEVFTRLNLASVDPVSCLTSLPGQFSTRPDQLATITPARLATSDALPSDNLVPADVDLHSMDPIDFEELVATLFRAMDMDVMTTARSGDGGVDIRAIDKDPIRGGKLIIQVKRYRHTIPPAPVRDLYGTMLHEGASRGILVTTATFGPSAKQFAAGKPLALIDGSHLTELLTQYGITCRNDRA